MQKSLHPLSTTPLSRAPQFLAATLMLGSLLAVSACSAPSSPEPKTADVDFSVAANDERIAEWIDNDDRTPLTWQKCDSLDKIEVDASRQASLASLNVECAALEVPLNWFDQDKKTTTLPLMRVLSPSAAPAGDIMLNPGGPGGSGTEMALELAMRPTTEQLRTNFNLLGFDPRGVSGLTSAGDPLECGENPRCKANKKLAHNASTAAVAHDMEYLRIQLGEKPLNYFAYSYGTYLGSVYATLFPDEVGLMVLDGPADAQGYTEAGEIEQSTAFASSRERFLEACIAGEIGPCPFTGNANKAEEMLAEAAAKLKKKPVTLDDGREVNGDTIDSYLGAALYGSRTTWPETAATLTGILNSDPAVFDTVASMKAEVSDDMQNAVVCSIAEGRETGGCGTQKVLDPPVLYSGTATILVFAVTGDPATPFVGAHRFTEALGNAVLVTVTGEGHASVYKESPCIDTLVNDYFLSGSIPAEGTRCAK